jgi:hypothetical protein
MNKRTKYRLANLETLNIIANQAEIAALAAAKIKTYPPTEALNAQSIALTRCFADGMRACLTDNTINPYSAYSDDSLSRARLMRDAWENGWIAQQYLNTLNNQPTDEDLI